MLFCSHICHHLLALWVMGANAELLRDAYKTHASYQRPAMPTPQIHGSEGSTVRVVIDETNWKDFLGDER